MFKTAASLLAVIALIAVLSVAPASAADDADDRWNDTRIITDKFNVSLGGLLGDFKTDAAVGTGTLLSASIRLEDQLSIEQYNNTFRLAGFYRFKPKHQLAFGYFGLNRAGTTVLDEEVSCCGYTWGIDAAIDSEFKVGVLTLTYKYSFVNNRGTEAGFTAGLSFYEFELALSGEGDITEVPDAGANKQGDARVSADEGIIAPIPTVGMYITHAFTPKFLINFRASFLNLDVGDFTGRVVDSSVTVDYYFTKHFGIGGGTNTSDIKFESTGGDNPFRVEYRQSGLLGYLSFVF